MTTHDQKEHLGTLEFYRNKKSFRMEKNKKRLRIIGDGNRVYIHCNLGRLEIVGDRTSVWIARNEGPVQFTGNHGRIYVGDQSAVRVVDYIGSDGRVTVLEDRDIMDWTARKVTERNCVKGKREVKEEGQEAFREIVVTKEYLIPVSSDCVPSKKSSSAIVSGWLVTSELRIRTNIVGDVTKSHS